MTNESKTACRKPAPRAAAVLLLAALHGVYALDFPTGRHGAYSSAYLSDWRALPNGKHYPRKQRSDYRFERKLGEEVKRRFINQKNVHITGKYWQVHWNTGPGWKSGGGKYATSLFHVRNCEQVLIEDMAIVQLDGDYRASHAFVIEGCGDVIVRNVYISGATPKYHLRIEGCERVFIDNVEVCGNDYGESGVRCGSGIMVHNGEGAGDKNFKIYSPDPRELQWCVIQNCYVHDYLAIDKRRNQDGIIVTSARAGILFNCYVENWKQSDAALDISHRRRDPGYTNNVFRVERCVFKNNNMIKTSGGLSNPDNSIVFCNNVFINTWNGCYHDGYANYWLHNTHVVTPAGKARIFWKLWGISAGATSVFRNNLLHVYDAPLEAVFYATSKRPIPARDSIKSDYFLHLMPKPKSWIGGTKKEIWTGALAQWREGGQDAHSVLGPPEDPFRNREREDFRLRPASPARDFGTAEYLAHKHPGLRVDRDFLGNRRDSKPDAGAFELGGGR